MRRLRGDLPGRADAFSHRMVDVAEALDANRKFKRVIDQIVGCGTSVGANTSEADEAVSEPDFCKSLGTVLKELNECRFWLRFVSRRDWVPAARLTGLQQEADELKLIYGAILTRTRRRRKN